MVSFQFFLKGETREKNGDDKAIHLFLTRGEFKSHRSRVEVVAQAAYWLGCNFFLAFRNYVENQKRAFIFGKTGLLCLRKNYTKINRERWRAKQKLFARKVEAMNYDWLFFFLLSVARREKEKSSPEKKKVCWYAFKL